MQGFNDDFDKAFEKMSKQHDDMVKANQRFAGFAFRNFGILWVVSVLVGLSLSIALLVLIIKLIMAI